MSSSSAFLHYVHLQPFYSRPPLSPNQLTLPHVCSPLGWCTIQSHTCMQSPWHHTVTYTYAVPMAPYSHIHVCSPHGTIQSHTRMQSPWHHTVTYILLPLLCGVYMCSNTLYAKSTVLCCDGLRLISLSWPPLHQQHYCTMCHRHIFARTMY